MSTRRGIPGCCGPLRVPFAARGLGVPWVPVLGDHDALVAGELVPTELTRSLALGGRSLWDLPSGLTLPPGFRSRPAGPDGPVAPVARRPAAGRSARAARRSRVPADAARREMAPTDVVSRLLPAPSPSARQLCDGIGDWTTSSTSAIACVWSCSTWPGATVGSGGLVVAGQPEWLAAQSAGAGGRCVIVVSHQAAWDLGRRSALLDLLDRSSSVIATLSGHTHRNRIAPSHSPAGGYWQIETASLIDYPQQARALRVLGTRRRGRRDPDLDARPRLSRVPRHDLPRALLPRCAGGPPRGFAGTRSDRNVVLFCAPR